MLLMISEEIYSRVFVSRADVEETSRLKYRREPDPHSRRRPSSIPILQSALESSKVYKYQTVHEIRTRPIDRIPRPVTREILSDKFRVEKNHIDEYEPVEIHQDRNTILGVEPKRFYVLNN